MARRFRFAGLVSMFAVMLLATVFVVAACSDTDGSASIAAARAGDTMAAANGRGDDDPAANKGTGGNGEDAERSPDATHPAPGTAVGPLSQEEQTALLYLREEEKLAHDVYVTLYEKWGTRVFDNISSSELRHMESMRSLLDSYGLADPVRNDTIGVFTDSELQALYDSLVAQGGASEAAALEVGMAIETKDIQDLEALIAITAHGDIREVAENLLAGSRNHLAAFSRGR